MAISAGRLEKPEKAQITVKFITWIFGFLIGIVFIALAIANRQPVTFYLDPVPLQFEAPLYLIVFFSLFIGLVVGGVVTWINAGRWRRETKKLRRQVSELKNTSTSERPAISGNRLAVRELETRRKESQGGKLDNRDHQRKS